MNYKIDNLQYCNWSEKIYKWISKLNENFHKEETRVYKPKPAWLRLHLWGGLQRIVQPGRKGIRMIANKNQPGFEVLNQRVRQSLL